MAHAPLTYLGSQDVAAALEQLDVLEVVRDTLLAVHANEAGIAEETSLHWEDSEGSSNRSLMLPAWTAEASGVKVINASLGNQRRGLPRAQGLIVLNDMETAHPRAIMEAAQISSIRTAAVSVVALQLLQRAERDHAVGVLGCGVQARRHLALLGRVRPLGAVVLHDQEPAAAETLAAELREGAPDLSVVTVANPREVCEQATTVIAATTTTRAYVELDWMLPGSTFVNVSLDDAAESLLVDCDRLVVDDWPLVSSSPGRLLGRLAIAGRVVGPGVNPVEGQRAVDGDLPSLAASPWTPGEEARVVVNPFGMGVHDVALARRVAEVADEQGLGLALDR